MPSLQRGVALESQLDRVAPMLAIVDQHGRAHRNVEHAELRNPLERFEGHGDVDAGRQSRQDVLVAVGQHVFADVLCPFFVEGTLRPELRRHRLFFVEDEEFRQYRIGNLGQVELATCLHAADCRHGETRLVADNIDGLLRFVPACP